MKMWRVTLKESGFEDPIQMIQNERVSMKQSKRFSLNGSESIEFYLFLLKNNQAQQRPQFLLLIDNNFIKKLIKKWKWQRRLTQENHEE